MVTIYNFTVSGSRRSFRSQKQITDSANIHSRCAVVLQKNHDPNLYPHAKISVGGTVIHLF